MPRRPLARALLAAALAVPVCSAAMGQTTRPNAPPAEVAADVPVRAVTLFTSGVGYFERAGTVDGDAGTTLPFKAEQINDVLKSLVLQDLDGGRAGVVTYPGQDPLGRKLAGFGVDVSGNPSLAALLIQLRGAEVTVALGAGRPDVTGTVVGVEVKRRPVGKDDGGGLAEVAVLNLLAGAALRSIPLDDVQSLELTDPALRQELAGALAAVAGARDQDKKPVEIDFRGTGERRVRIGYVVETPVWKTSYRLVLAPDAPAETPANKPATRAATATLQGWAIVENQTDTDWTDVQLSLVSGRPISFVQDLYQSLYAPRPTVRPELYAGLTPQQYGGGIASSAELKDEAQSQSPMRMMRAPASAAPMPDDAAAAADADAELGFYYGRRIVSLDPTASVAAAASAGDLGALFQYTVPGVTLPRQTSAMIPIVTDPIDAERLSIYNQSVLAQHPLNGVRLTNTTGKQLPSGPVTVYDGGYAGDARLDDLPPGQDRLVSFGVDLDVRVDATKQTSTTDVVGGKVVQGVLELSRKTVYRQTYAVENKSDADRSLVVEHPVRPGTTLVDTPEPAEATEQVYRFRVEVPAGGRVDLAVAQQQVTGQSVVLADVEPRNFADLAGYTTSGRVPADVRAALDKAATLAQAVNETARQIEGVESQLQSIADEQGRLRQNMGSVDRDTAYYARLLEKLDDQETQVESLRERHDGLRETLDEQRAAFVEYLKGLSVG